MTAGNTSAFAQLLTHEHFNKSSNQLSYFWKLIIPELRVLVLTKRRVGSGNEIGFLRSNQPCIVTFLVFLVLADQIFSVQILRKPVAFSFQNRDGTLIPTADMTKIK